MPSRLIPSSCESRWISRSRAIFRQHDFDFYGAVTLGERHVNVVNMLAYDRNDADMAHRADALWGHLAAAVASQADAEAYLRERFVEIFPLARLAGG